MPEVTQSNLTVPGKPRKPLDVAGLLRRRLLLVLVLGALLAAALAPLFWLFGGASYRTEGVLLIDPGKEPTLSGRERETIPGNVGDYTRTLLNRLMAGDVLLDALEAVPVANWPSFLDARRPPEANIGRLFKALKAREVPRTYLMTVEVAGDTPEGLAPLLNAVLESFIAKLGRELEQQNARRLAYLRAERNLIETRIDAERQRILDLAETVSSKAFLHESYTVHLSKLEQIQRLYWEAEAVRAARTGELRRTEGDSRALQQLGLQAYADERVADNFGINRIEQWTYEQLQSLRSTIDGLTTNNGDRTYVEMRMAAMNDYLAAYKQEVNDLTIRVLTEKRAHDLTTDIIRASNALAAATATSETLGQRLDEARREASDTSEAIFQAADPSFTVSQLRERLTAINNRIDDCEMESKAPLRLAIDRPAGDPTRPAANTQPRFATLGALLAFALVIGGVLLFEMLDNRVRGLAEVAAALGAAPPDPVPLLTDGCLARVLIEQPDSTAGAALRALAVRLNRARLKHGARLFAFSAVGDGAGNTSLALNAAHALVCYTPRVLLLALGRNGAAVHAGLGPTPAGAGLLCHPDRLGQAIVSDPDRGIDLVCALPDGTALPSKTGLIELLERTRSLYDAVVLDLGSVPDDDLAVAALAAVDAVVFTVREDRTLYRNLRRALETAVAAGVPSLSVVLNATRRRPAGWLSGRIQSALRPVSLLHRRAAAEWNRRLHRHVTPPPGEAQP